MPDKTSGHRIALKAGDVLFKHCDYSAEHLEIAFGQLFGRGNAKIIHAAIVTAENEVMSFDGGGPKVEAPSQGELYEVYRCLDRPIARDAARFASFTFERRSKVGYRYFGSKGALRSIWSRQLLQGTRRSTAIEHKILHNRGYAFSVRAMSRFATSLHWKKAGTG